MDEQINPALQVAKRRDDGPASQIRTLSTGVRARVVPVGASLIDEATSLVKPPPVPKFYNDSKGREEENPNDPLYLAELALVERRRAQAAMDAMVMFGLELADPLPEDDTWLRKLKLLERRGALDLSAYDLDDPLDLEFLYKKFIATGTQDLILIGRMAGLRAEDVAEAAENFPGKP